MCAQKCTNIKEKNPKQKILYFKKIELFQNVKKIILDFYNYQMSKINYNFILF